MRLKRITFPISTNENKNRSRLYSILNDQLKNGFTYGLDTGLTMYLTTSSMWSITHYSSGLRLVLCKNKVNASKVMKELINSEIDFTLNEEYLLKEVKKFREIKLKMKKYINY